MKLPYFKSWDKTPIVVEIAQEGMDENGVPLTAVIFDGLCNFTGKTKSVMTAEGKYVNLGGMLTVHGDIAPNIPNITGTATINQKARKIHNSEKVLNPDGTVNHTRLELL